MNGTRDNRPPSLVLNAIPVGFDRRVAVRVGTSHPRFTVRAETSSRLGREWAPDRERVIGEAGGLLSWDTELANGEPGAGHDQSFAERSTDFPQRLVMACSWFTVC